MKYRFTLTIEDTGRDEEILIIKESGVSRNRENCYKAVRKSITQCIKEHLNKLKESQDSLK